MDMLEYERKSETIHICNKLFLLCFAFNFSSAYDPSLFLSYLVILPLQSKKERSFLRLGFIQHFDT